MTQVIFHDRYKGIFTLSLSSKMTNVILYDNYDCSTPPNYATRGKVLRALVNRSLTQAELAELESREQNGAYALALKDLQYAGFAEEDTGLNPLTGKPVKQARYRVKDNYSRFYLKVIEPRAAAIKKGLFKFSSVAQLDGWGAILGLQFENLILNHVTDLFPLLGLERSLVLSAAPYVQNATKRNRDCQIDLLIQTSRMLMVVEIKRQKQITHGIIEEVDAKVRHLRHARETSVRTALVYDGELVPSVPADHYFDFIVPASKLFE